MRTGTFVVRITAKTEHAIAPHKWSHSLLAETIANAFGKGGNGAVVEMLCVYDEDGHKYELFIRKET